MKRRYNDASGASRGAMGIDGGKDDGYARSGKVGHLVQDAQTSNHKEGSYSRNSKRGQDKYTEVGITKMPGMRTVDDFGYTASSRDILDDVEANSGSGASGPVKYGVNKRQ
jgi:hypothetical protein